MEEDLKTATAFFESIWLLSSSPFTSSINLLTVLLLYSCCSTVLLREQGLGTRSKICYSRCSELDENHVYYLIKEQVELKNYNVATYFC